MKRDKIFLEQLLSLMWWWNTAWEQKHKMEELADENEYFGISDFVDVVDPSLTNWANGCPPYSALRQAEVPDSSSSKSLSISQHRSFIYDHKAAMNLCQHPENIQLHGVTASLGTNLGELLPLFAFAKTVVHSDILATPLEQYSSFYIGDDPKWADKSLNKVLWRGSTTGVEFATNVQWELSQRARLHFLSHAIEVSMPLMYADEKGKEQHGNFAVKQMNTAYLDTSFSGEPAQCDPETCEEMAQTIEFQPAMGLEESYQSKYLIDIDDNAWSGRFHRLMSTNSLVLKSTTFPEWYGDRLVEWVHYVPVKVDYTDVYDILGFFIGTTEGKNGHDEVAEKIATAGKEWAEAHWRREDMASYMFRLLLEWGRILHRENELFSPDYTN